MPADVPDPGTDLFGPQLAGRVTIVTGAGGRGDHPSIGQAIAVHFADHGARVIIADRDPAAADFTLQVIVARGGSAVSHIADVTGEEACAALVAAACARFGRLDILVNNVGSGGTGLAAGEVTQDAWTAMMDINLKSATFMAKHAVGAMGEGGAIVNISSLSVRRIGRATLYAMAKSGVETLTRALAEQYGPQGIRANCVVPGQVWTPSVAASYDDAVRETVRSERRLRTALRREGSAWDIARAARFLASDEARWITGQPLLVDGGRCLL